MAEIQEYKCPCCDGAIAFDAQSQKLKCPFCATEFDIETLSSYNETVSHDGEDKLDWENKADNEWDEGEEESLNVYTCNSCGGEIVSDENTAATSCPYCDNPVVLTGRVSGTLKPDLVIPFKLDKNAAIEALKNHYKGKVLLPKLFKQENHIQEIKGVYVPFWLFDTETDAHMRYKATRTRFWSDSRYNYTETSYYSVVRGGTLEYEKVPVDGSSKMPNDLMESLEPFHFHDAVDFQTAYLAGFFADKYDVSAEDSAQFANARIRESTEKAFRNTVTGYNTVTPQASKIQFRGGTYKYALYPVWMLTTKWKEQLYTFAINGQTGKLAGNLPMDKGAYFKWLFGLTAAIGIIGTVISYLSWLS